MIEPVRFEQPSPQEIHVTWRDRKKSEFRAVDLRRECPCASCVDELTGRKILDPATVADEIAIIDADIVGRYAFRFTFSDSHSTGLYTFERLYAFGESGAS